MIGERTDHHGRVLAGFRHFVKIANGADTRRRGQGTVRANRSGQSLLEAIAGGAPMLAGWSAGFRFGAAGWLTFAHPDNGNFQGYLLNPLYPVFRMPAAMALMVRKRGGIQRFS